MRTINYYQPTIRAVAKNGSDRLGVTLVTQMWETGKEERKMELSIHAKNEVEVRDKFAKTMQGENELKEHKCEYYLCTKSVVEQFKPFEVSKPFKSGFEYDTDGYYVAWLNFAEVEAFYKEFEEELDNSMVEFWCNELVPGTMDVSKISMKSANKNGLFLEISIKLNLMATRNQAMTIYNLSQKYGCNTVQLINKYL